MGLVTKPVTVSAGAWIGAFAKVAPGVTVGEDAVIGFGGVLVDDAESSGIYFGNPAKRIGTRTVQARQNVGQIDNQLRPRRPAVPRKFLG
jgi:acetyltransferase-like isoleucine patch superfamily enzyme